MDRIDFRSDTVSWPTPAMREAMARAQVGDDVYGEDPTVNELEELAAAKVGKEAALLVSSGTMGNLASILSHTNRGDEAIVGVDAHSYRSEAGGMAALGGVIPTVLPTGPDGRMDYNDIRQAISPDDPHHGRTRLILLENSYAARVGTSISVDYFRGISEIAEQHDLKIHLDGARLFNAATALHVDATQITQYVDSLTFCLSKGLCAPVGSLVCGSKDFIKRARRARKILGGGMRQAGVLAAAGIIALETMIGRLGDDHECARQLAEKLKPIPGLTLQTAYRPTNMVFFSLDKQVRIDADALIEFLQKESNVFLGKRGDRTLRAVTHYWIGKSEVEKLASGVRYALNAAA